VDSPTEPPRRRRRARRSWSARPNGCRAPTSQQRRGDPGGVLRRGDVRAVAGGAGV